MRNQLFFLGLILSLAIALFNPLYAQVDQDSTQIWRIVMVDGNEFYGNIIFENQDYIEIQTALLGNLKIVKTDIKVQEYLDKAVIKAGDVWLENLQATRYFWAPNGYGLEKGEGYYQNVWVLFNQASVGVTKNFSIGAGIIPLFLFAGAPTPIFIVPKFSIPIVKEKFNMGAGAIVGTIVGGDDFNENGLIGIAYGVATIGHKDSNATFGMGYGFFEGELAEYPLFTLGGLTRISRRSYLLTENYLISLDGTTVGLASIGGRTVWQRVSIDYGLVIPFGADLDEFIGIPWLGLSVPFQY